MSLAQTFRLLDEAKSRLTQAVGEVSDWPPALRRKHLARLQNVLARIYDVQYHIFALRPELTPHALNRRFEYPEGAWRIAMRHVRAAERNRNLDLAIAILQWLAPRVSHSEYEERARFEIARLMAMRQIDSPNSAA